MKEITIRKAVLNQYNDNVLGFVDVEKNTREIEVALNVNFLRTHGDEYTGVVKTMINVRNYKVSSDKKWFTNDYLMHDSISSAKNQSNETVFYISD